jgi:hypothetical protein
MINVRFIESIIGIITMAIAYILSATTAGYVQAWIAKKMGDDTPEQAGFLTWNPLVHIDPLGAFFLLSMGIGWMRYMPINQNAIRSRLGLAAVYFSNVIVYLSIALISLIILLRVFGLRMLDIAMAMILNRTISLTALESFYPNVGSFSLVIALILVVGCYLSVMFAVLYFLIDGFRFFLFVISPELDWVQENDILGFIIPIILIVIFAPTMRMYVVYGISMIAYYIAHLLGAG